MSATRGTDRLEITGEAVFAAGRHTFGEIFNAGLSGATFLKQPQKQATGGV